MDSNIIVAIIFAVCWIALLIFTFCMLWFKILPYKYKKLELEEKKVKNEKFDIFLKMDPKEIQDRYNDYIETNVNRYITYKFIAKKSMYIKQEEVETMVKDLTKAIYIEISELYIFYINTLVSISDDNSLLEYIHSSVKTACVEAVTAYNKSMN